MPRLCPPARLHAAMTLVEDDLDAGLDQLAGLARKYAKDPAVRYGYGAALMDAGRNAEAVDHLEFAERREPTEDVRETLLEAYFSLGMILHAERLLRRTGGNLDDEVDADVEIFRNHGADWREVPRKDLLAFERARTAMVRRDLHAVRDLARLAERHPTWTPVLTALAGARLAAGELDGYYAAADAAFEADPEEALPLVHAVRAAYMRNGTAAARAFTPRIPQVRSRRGEAHALAVRAEAAALMDDEAALREALDAFEAARFDHAEDEAADVERLREALDRRAGDPDAPLASVADMVFGLFWSWVGRGEDDLEERAGRDLARAPGLLRELPRRLGYEDASTVRILAGVLLSAGAPPAPEGSWNELLARVATEGPGTRSSRAALLGFLHEVGRLDASDAVPFAGTEEGVTIHDLEISGEPLPNSLNDRDQERLETAMRDMARGRVAPALAVLSELVEAYPDEASLAFNLAMTERLSGRQDAARARLERLVETHPDYLFARADLAVGAIEAGDPDRAESLLTYPAGRTRLHAQEWATYAAALGRLALERGDVEGAESYLDGIDRVTGSDSGAYRMLEAALDAYVLDAEEEQATDAWHDTGPTGRTGSEPRPTPARDRSDVPEALESTDASDAEDVPSLEELLDLPQREEAWPLASLPVAFPIGEEGEMQRLGLLAVTDDDGLVRAMTMHEEPLDEDTALAYVAEAFSGETIGGRSERPRTVITDAPELPDALETTLGELGVRVVRGDASAAHEAVRSVTESMGSGVPAWLAYASPLEARTFLHACDAFFGAEAWNEFAPDRPLAFRVGNGAWRYASLMGHGGDEFGVAIFPSWIAYEALTDPDVPDEERLSAAGALEGVSLTPIGAISPLDARIYLDVFGVRHAEDAVPHFARHEPDGFGAADHGPSVYAALLTLLAQRAERVTTRVRRIDTTVDTPEGPMRVRYPATGAEPVEEPPGHPAEA